MSTVEISWPSGQKDTLHDLAADFIYTIEEGTGVRSKQAFAATDCPKEDACTLELLFLLNLVQRSRVRVCELRVRLNGRLDRAQHVHHFLILPQAKQAQPQS